MGSSLSSDRPRGPFSKLRVSRGGARALHLYAEHELSRWLFTRAIYEGSLTFPLPRLVPLSMNTDWPLIWSS
jgi:hypothetical protein